jgi:DNA-binding transcriptional regulator GbsR (MarR family)
MSANKFLKIIQNNKNNLNKINVELNNLKNNLNKINVELNNLKNNLNENNNFYDYKINMIDCKIMMVGGVLFIIPYFLK